MSYGPGCTGHGGATDEPLRDSGGDAGINKSVKILFATAHIGIFRHLESTIRELCASGHAVHYLRGPISKENASERALRACEVEASTLTSGPLLARGDAWAAPLRELRDIAGYAAYLQPDHPSAHLRERWVGHVTPPLRPLLRARLGQMLLANERVRSVLRRIQEVAPPDPLLVTWLRKHAPDVVVCSPFIFSRSLEPEYVKAARALGIPTMVAIASWDNLTTKSVFPLLPDFAMVWNNALADELMRLHGVPRTRIVVTGAPTFDYWFGMTPSLDRPTFCAQVGIDPARPYVLYLCSSKFIARDETVFVRRFAATLAQHAGTSAVQVVVRPHPNHTQIWSRVSDPQLVVWPRRGEIPDTPEVQQDYFNALYHSQIVVGVNTSAFLDAAVVDRPCLTILSAEYEKTQVGIGHFRHLMAGQFLEQARSFEEAAVLMETILRGGDSRRDGRRDFVRRFVRPCGLETPAGVVMARAVEAACTRLPISLQEVAAAQLGSPCASGSSSGRLPRGLAHDQQ